MKVSTSNIKHIALALVIAGTFGSALHGASAQIAHADGDTTVACTSNSWPTLPNLNFDRVTPGSLGGANEAFISHAAGNLSATVTDGANVFQVTGMESFQVKKVRVPIDLSEMPPGYHGPRFYYETDCTPDTTVDGSTPLTITAGEMVQVFVKGTPDPSRVDYSGTLSISEDTTSTVQVPMHMFVGGIKASLDTASLSIPQGRSGDIPVTVTSLGGDDTDATFDLYDSVDGITVTNPTVHVAAGQTVHANLHVVVARGAPLGDENYNLAVSAFNDRQTIGLGSLTLTVTPLPVQSVVIPLGAAADAWNAARNAACDRIKDLTGQQVLAYLGRTIRNPDCYLAPLQMSATQSGNELTITGSAPGNWVSFYVTTPDGIPSWLDPDFTANYDVTMSMTVDLPQSLDGNSTLRVKSIDVAVQNAYLDSHNLTGDIVESVAKAFGGSQYFHPADYALGDAGDAVTGAINSALSQLDGVLQAAPASGFTQIDFSLDPATLELTVTIS
jgi:hypothetical protein